MNILRKSLATVAVLLVTSVVAADAYARCVSMCGYSTSPWGGIDKVYFCDDNGNVCRVMHTQEP